MYDYKRKSLNLRRDFDFLLSKTLSMFRYEGLPETMPHRDFERQLQTKGYAFVTEFEGELYSFTDGLGGEPDAYGNPTQIVIANPALGFNKTLDLKEDGVLVRNDSMMAGIRNLMKEKLYMLNENKISMIMNSFNSRIPTLISAGDDGTREAAEEYLRQVVNGELGIIAENRLFEGINAQATGGAGSVFTQLIEYNQFIEASLYNELGLEMNNNMKRERLTEDEVNMVDTIYPFVDNMMMNRAAGIEAINKKYGKNIEIEFDSIWANHNEQTDEEFLAEVQMYLDEAQPQDQGLGLEAIFGDTTDEDLDNVLSQLLELDEEVLEDGDNDSGRDDSDTDSAAGLELVGGSKSEGGESGTDTGASGSDRPDSSESGTDESERDTGSVDADSATERDDTDDEPGDESTGGDKSDDTESGGDNAEPSDESSGGDTESTTEESGEVSGEEPSETVESETSSSVDTKSESSSSVSGTSTDDTSGGTDSGGTDEAEQGERDNAEPSDSGPTTGTSSDEEEESGRDTISVEVDVDVNTEKVLDEEVKIEEDEEDES